VAAVMLSQREPGETPTVKGRCIKLNRSGGPGGAGGGQGGWSWHCHPIPTGLMMAL